jgi:predicted nucleotidyltransferase
LQRILKAAKGRIKILKEWRVWAERIAQASAKLLGDVEVFVLGSAVKGELVVGSDIDILIVSPKLPRGNWERAGLKAELEELSGLPLIHPVEIHLANPGEAEFYFKHAKGDILRIYPKNTLEYSSDFNHTLHYP